MVSKKAIAIDGNCLFYRCFYATIKQLTYFESKQLKPTNALNLFIRIVIKLIRSNNYDYGIVAFDYSKDTFRKKKLKTYKEGRKKMPNELVCQISDIKQCVNLMGIKKIEVENFEADDIIGSFSKLMTQNNVYTEIFSSDKDMLQLVNEFTTVKLLKKGISDFIEYNLNNFPINFFGLFPNQVVDFKAISGDKSDHLQGVRGIGIKTSIELLKAYKTLDNIYLNLDKLTRKNKEKFVVDKDDVYLCKDLVTIRTNLFDGANSNDFNLGAVNYVELLNFTRVNKLDSLSHWIEKLFLK